jgi:glutamate dehydrogenase
VNKKSPAKAVSKSEISPLEVAHAQIIDTSKKIRLHAELLELLLTPQRVLEVDIPVAMDSGSTRVFKGWRVLHNDSRGAGKGGVRFDLRVNLDEVTALATWMSLKTAVVGIPYGGGKGGVRVNPQELSKRELALLARGYVRQLLERDPTAFGPFQDIPAPDMNTNAIIMSWFVDEYLRYQVQNQRRFLDDTLFVALNHVQKKFANQEYDPTATVFLDEYVRIIQKDLEDFRVEKESAEIGVFTGKPVPLGGSLGREKATGQGVYFVTEQVLHEIGEKIGIGASLQGRTVIVQGYGNVGSNCARIFHKAGATIVAVSDQWGGIHNPEGIDLAALDLFLKEEQAQKRIPKVGGFPQAKPVTNEQLLELPAEILVPAACENQITGKNAGQIQARLVVEAANGPTTPDADRILAKRNIVVVPDILANAGGVVVSYFEWLQNISTERWQEIAVEKMLQERMRRATAAIFDISRTHRVNLREAANMLAVMKLVDAEVAEQPSRKSRFKSTLPYARKDGAAFKIPETLEQLAANVEEGGFEKLVDVCHDQQSREIDVIGQRIVGRLAEADGGSLFAILVTGPNTSGKQGFSHQLKSRLISKRNVCLFNLDNLGMEALKQLLGRSTARDLVVICGDRACGDEVLSLIPSTNRFGIFINTAPSLRLTANYVLTSSDLRLMREILDEKRRNGTLPLATVRSWPRKRSAQSRDVYPTWKNADHTFNSYTAYELPILKHLLGQELSFAMETAITDGDHIALRILHRLFKMLEGVPSMPPEFLPPDSILQQLVSDRHMFNELTRFPRKTG